MQNMELLTLLAALIFVFGFHREASGIKITRFMVPTTVQHKSQINLDCAYELENDSLYAVKWYKDDNEFFRCTSDDRVFQFEVEGVAVYHDGKASLGSCPVLLTDASPTTSGHYKCEVCGDGPEFKIAARSTFMNVIAIHVVQLSRRTDEDDPTLYPLNKNDKLHEGETNAICRNCASTSILLLTTCFFRTIT